MKINNTIKPKLYQNGNLPLMQLSSNAFEDFVYQALVLLGEQKGFKMLSGRQPSGDGGFDSTAKDTKDNGLICIQCKRYKNSLSTQVVSEEIVKVALNRVLDNSIPKQHYIISTGEVSKNLRILLREDGYINLKQECKKLIDSSKSLSHLVSKIKKQSKNPYEIVCDYLDSLENLIVWSGIDFENELIVIWSQLCDVLEKHFSLAVVLKEHPRSDFDVKRYLEKIHQKNENNKLVSLFFQQTHLPINLEIDKDAHKTEQILSVEDLVNLLKNDKKILLSSKGGSGKSSTLILIEKYLTNSFEDIQYIPVKINLRSYSRNTLKQKIEQKLEINYGSWKSLPYKFIFLFDGLDEMLQSDTQTFMDEIFSLIDEYSFIITVRNTGLNINTTLPLLDYCLSIQPLSYRSAFEIAEKTFQGDELKDFYDEYRKALDTIGFNFLSLPFVLSMTIDYYKKHKAIPNNIEDILENWIKTKIKKDSSKAKDTSNKVNQIPTKYIEEIFSEILYKSRIEKKLFSIPKDRFSDIVYECYYELKQSDSAITNILNVQEFVSMIFHYEIFTLGEDNHYSTPHTIISDYLISKKFAKNWKKHKKEFLINSFYDIWLYSSNFINDEDKEEFLSLMLSYNLQLGAKVSKKFGEKFIKQAESVILESEKSKKILRRIDAIYALGILATDSTLKRLLSKTDFLDREDLWHRLRSLALQGDKNTLLEILKENEFKAQAPIKISGGTYSLWFDSPPFIVTDIARERLSRWKEFGNTPICLCLRTIADYGDSFDIDILEIVIKETQVVQEFYDACAALNMINEDILIALLKEVIADKHHFSYEAKKVLLELGIKSNIDDEFGFFIESCKKSEEELAKDSYMMKLVELAEFIEKFELTKRQKDKLVETYKNLKFSNDFYIYWLFWEIASKSKSDFFLPIVELAFSCKNSEEINQALHYLSSFENLEISNTLSKKIDDYFPFVDEKSYGLKMNYAKYYLMYGEKEIAHKIIKENVEKLINDREPETITYDKYAFSSVISANTIFELFKIDQNLKFEDSVILKLLLIGTRHVPKEDEIKSKLLSKIDIKVIENYANKIIDKEVKIDVFDYLLKNDFCIDPVKILQEYLPIFLSHHFYYPTIQKVCKDNWNDGLSEIFLSSFINHSWTSIDTQRFEDYIAFYANLFTKEQLEKFERQRTKFVNPLISKMYRIWLEANDVNYKKLTNV